jgi:hypothetical protein
MFMLSCATLFGISLTAGGAAIFTFATKQSVEVEPIVFFVTYGAQGLMVGLIAFFCIQKFFKNPGADRQSILTLNGWKVAIAFIGTILAIAIGAQVVNLESINWLFIPVLTIPAVALPIWFMLGVGAQKISLGARWQAWSIFGLSMTAAPFILVILEIMVAIFFVIGVIIHIASRPELVFEMQRLSEQLMNLDTASPNAIDLLAPYIAQPVTVILALSYFSIIVPMLEEIFKPLGVWLFGARIESIAQGFALGAVSGAGYAVIETWHHRRYLFSIGMYLLSVLLHGLWNAATIAFSFSTITSLSNSAATPAWINTGALVSMLLLTALLLGILFFTNRKLNEGMSPSNENPPIKPTPDSYDKIIP